MTVLLIVVVAVIAGAWLRFQNLDGKVYWADECLSSLRMAGFTEKEIVQDVGLEKPFSAPTLLKYQRLSAQKSWLETVRSCALEDPLQPPLYYLLLRAWAHLFGASETALRLLSVVASLVALLAIYFLIRELLPDKTSALIAMALMAVSPLQVLYAQEARPYSLLICAILLTGTILLRALRLNNKSSWLAYLVLIAMSLYLQPLFLLVVAAQAVYVWYYSLTLVGKAEKHLVRRFLSSLAAAVLVFLPWAILIFTSMDIVLQKTMWMSAYRTEFSNWSKLALLNIARTVVDFNQDQISIFWLTELIALVLIIYALFTFARNAPKNTRVFVFALMIIPSLPLLLLDLIGGGIRAIIARYFFPLYLGLLVMIAFVLAGGIRQNGLFKRALWSLIAITVLTAGILSSYQIVEAPIWWNKAPSKNNLTVAGFLNQQTKPLLLASCPADNLDLAPLLALSHLLNDNVYIALSNEPNVLELPPGFSSYFIFMPSEQLRHRLVSKYACVLQPLTSELWLLQGQKL